MFCVKVIGFKVAKSPPAHVNARENPRPKTGLPVGRALVFFTVTLHEQSTNHTSLKIRPRCYLKSPTVQEAFQCTGVTGRSHVCMFYVCLFYWYNYIHATIDAKYVCVYVTVLA